MRVMIAGGGSVGVSIALDLLDLGVERGRRRFEGVELLEVGAVARGSVRSSVVSPAHAVNDRDDQGQEQQQD